jgi:hypothetical protein
MVRGTGIHGSHDRAGWRLAGVPQFNHDDRTRDKRISKLSLFSIHKEFLRCARNVQRGRITIPQRDINRMDSGDGDGVNVTACRSETIAISFSALPICALQETRRSGDVFFQEDALDLLTSCDETSCAGSERTLH